MIPFRLTEKWSEKYKRSIDCKNPKGFSQRAHCQGRSVREEYITEDMARADNRGLKAEDDLIASTPHFEEGGTSAGRGSDAYVTSKKSGKRLGVEIKSPGSAKGQTKFSRNTRGGWGYHAGDSFATALNNHMGKRNARRHLHSTYGAPEGDVHDHVRNVHNERGGELHLRLGGSVNDVAKLIHGGMNHNDIYHDTKKGSYALTDAAAKSTGLPHIRDHINPKAAARGDVVSVRHRVKTHSSPKGDKPGVYSTTAQLNIDHNHLSPSTHDITQMGDDFHPVGKKRTTKK